MMTYEQACAFAGQAAKSGSILGLDSIRALMAELSDVQEKLPIIHIAGTNGKGSVGAYLASIFREAGLHVARYTSPAVFTPLEVFTYDGENIMETEYANVMSQVKDACDIIVSAGKECPTIFEIETAVAFLWFYEKKPDVVLLETGMGGELDATNLITHPLASVITSISMDHMQFLGDTIASIARAKAGIIKVGCPVYAAEQNQVVKEVLTAVASEKDAPIVFADTQTDILLEDKPGNMAFSHVLASGVGITLKTVMAGVYQVKNAALAAEAAYALLPVLMSNEKKEAEGRSYAKSLEEHILEIIRDGMEKTRWPGRFEVVSTEPFLVIDGAHNEDAAKQLAATIENCFTNARLTYIIGVLADKEHEKMLRIMSPFAKRVYTVTPHNARALDAERLAKEASNYYENVQACGSVEKALEEALSHEEPVLAFGSLSYLGNLKRAFDSLKK